MLFIGIVLSRTSDRFASAAVWHVKLAVAEINNKKNRNTLAIDLVIFQLESARVMRNFISYVILNKHDEQYMYII